MSKHLRRAVRAAAALAVCVAVAAPASARNEFSDYDVAAALAAEHSDNLLPGVPVYMKGQQHPRVARTLGTFRSNKPARSAMTSDEKACQRAFLSAVISLQQRALKEGGNAVVDIVSDTRGSTLESATQFRCVVGNIVANVALSGTVATLEQ